MNAIGLAVPVLMVLGIVAFVFLFRRGGGAFLIPSRSRAPRPRHIAVRIVCGVLGIGLLVTIGIGTWREMRGVYAADEQAGEIKLHLPKKPAPALPKPAEPNGSVSIGEARILVHIVFLQGNRPVYGEETEIHWPADRGRQFQTSGTWGGTTFTIVLNWRDLVVMQFGNDARVALEIQRRTEMRGKTWKSSSSGHGSWTVGNPNVIQDLGFGDSPNLLSVVRGPRMTTQIVCLTRMVAPDDPLKEVGLNEIARDADGRPDQEIRWSSRRYGGDAHMPAVFRLAESAGFSFAILLVAAILLAQCFARRGLAFAGTLAVCILYTVALDRMALGMHIAKLTDKTQPVATRSLAAESLAGTFFYRGTAWDAAKATANESSASEPLRKIALEVAEALRPKADVEFSAPKFSLSWDLKHAENAWFPIEEKHSGNGSHFILHIPAKEKHLGITPNLEMRVLSRGNNEDDWGAYLPLSWDNGRLGVELGSHAPRASYSLFSGTLTWNHELKQMAPNISTVIFHLNFVPQDRRIHAIQQDVSITVEVRADGKN
ncbi:MAG: hypothetical protein V1809_10130 [Planctomycetota bacterium]